MLLFCCNKQLQLAKQASSQTKTPTNPVCTQKTQWLSEQNNCIYTQHKKYDNMCNKAMLNEIK